MFKTQWKHAIVAGFLLVMLLASPLRAQTAVTVDLLDGAAYGQWCDGAEEPIRPADAKDESHRPQWIVWTTSTHPGHSGFKFGQSKTPGARHLRVAFTKAVAAGAVLVRGGAQVSVLKPSATYPGNMADESQWQPAQRLGDAALTREEGATDSYFLWTLPPGASIRALRFTHVANITDKEYHGYVGGICLFPSRLANLAPQAAALASANPANARRINNANADRGWDQWCNIPQRDGDRPRIVSAEDPEWVMLAWPAPVKLSGVAALFAGFGDADVQSYDGPADIHPREAAESAWNTVARFTGLKNRYPCTLGIDYLPFDREIVTRALRLRITRAMSEGAHPHTHGHTKDGKRVWLGELLALHAMKDEPLESVVGAAAPAGQQAHPPIAIAFTLPEAGWVTLVIEDAAGKRVRNLLADTYFPAGNNTAWWDGSDDLGRDPSAASHGLYYIPAQLVQPGAYRVRGLYRKQVDVKYEFGLYAAGSTPWETADRAGGWLANHTPPSSVLFVPDAPDGGRTRGAMLIGSYVSEGTAGLAWTDLDGKKWKGQNWVGGLWTGAPYLARDAGEHPLPGVYAYVAAAWNDGTEPKNKKSAGGEIRVTALTASEDKPIARYNFTAPAAGGENVRWETQIGGLTVRDALVVVSLPQFNQLLLVDAKLRKTIAQAALESPQGLAFGPSGRLLAISGGRIVAYDGIKDNQLPAAKVIIEKLDEPRGIAIDPQGNIYVSQRGQSHNVAVFSASGRPLRTIGKAGAPRPGAYDPLHMNNPRGLAIDPQGRLWAAEEDYQPKRVSVWNADGSLARAFYGPAEYGGGGAIDPADKTRFYYNGMEFHLDWEKGIDQLASVFYRPGADDLKLAFRAGVPQSAFRVQGRRYFTNTFNSSPTSGHGTAFIFLDRDGVAVPVAAAGRANDWDALKTPALAGAWPAGTDASASAHSNKAAFFIWSDKNGDGKVQPDELQMQRAVSGGVTVMRDLSIVISRIDDRSMQFMPTQFTPQGVPIYSLQNAKVIVAGAQTPPSSGGDQTLVATGGWSIHTTAPRPFPRSAIAGVLNGVAMWSYPSLWPGLHASHEAPVPDQPGMIIGHTRLLGDVVSPGGTPMWFLNGNTGCIYVFTLDGLFVAQLFQDMRVGQHWAMPAAVRGTVLNALTPGDENFWPSVTQTPDGAVYVIAGNHNCAVRVDGLESVRPIAPFTLNVSAADLDRAREEIVRAEAARQAAQGRGTLVVAIRKTAPNVDGRVDDWAQADWAEIDKRGTRAYFNSKSEPYNVTAAIAIAGDRLYAAWRTGDKALLANSGETPNALFKTGGALDLMIGADAAANPKRPNPVAGDQRLLITQVAGKTRALLYRAVVPGAKSPVPFSSPGRTIRFDSVEDVSAEVKLAAADGNYEISIPLAVLGLRVSAGQTILGDVGILRGNGSTTTQRVYWSNKATTIVADVPSEAELRPALWGKWQFKESP